MTGNRWLLAVLTMMAFVSASRGALQWKNLKAGMTPDAVQAQLGHPLLKSAGRGFEVWIYDAQTEVVWLRGVVVAWTPPGGSKGGAGEQIDVSGVVERVKPKPVKMYVPRGEAGPGYEKTRTRPRRWQSF